MRSGEGGRWSEEWRGRGSVRGVERESVKGEVTVMVSNGC